MKNFLKLGDSEGAPSTPRLDMIHVISNRLFFALGFLILIMIVGTYAVYKGSTYALGATTWVVLLMGFVGGFVGLQKRLKHLPDDDLVLLSNSWVMVLLSPMVGGVLAMLLYVLFISGLLSGELFPHFVADTSVEVSDDVVTHFVKIFAVRGDGYEDYAKLIFWCFVAGYSEKFVINIISQFESKAADTDNEEKD